MVIILVLSYFLILIGLLLLYLWLSGDRLRWLWPTPERTVGYWLFGVSNLLLLALCVGSRVIDRPSWLVVVMVFLPALELGFVYAFLRRGLALHVGVPENAETLRKRGSLWFRLGYVFAMASVFLPLSVFPTLAFFKVSHDEEMALLVKHGQLQLARAIEKRERRVKDRYFSVKIDKKEAFLEKRLKLQKAPDIYASFFFDTRFFDTDTDRSITGSATNHRGASGFEWVLRTIRPIYSDASVALRGVSGPGSADSAWEWERTGPPKQQLIITKKRVEDSNSLQMASTIPVLEGPTEVGGWIILLVGLVGFPVVLYLSVRVIAQRVFLRDVLDPPKPRYLRASQARAISDNLLVIGSPFAGKSAWLQQRVQRDDWHVIDFHKRSEAYNDEEVALAGHKVIALDHFEYQLGVPEQDHAKLLLLEKLLSTPQQLVIIVSTMDPMMLYWDDHAEREGATGEVPSGSHEKNSWARIFNAFLEVCISDEENAQDFTDTLSAVHAGSSSTKHQRELLRFVENECRPTAYLREVGRRIVTAPSFADYTPSDLRKVIWEQARAYYQVVWSTCSPGEQFLLICLAQDRFVNTRNPDIDQLLRKRLIVRNPTLCLMNESFERFVRSVPPPPQASTWEAEERHSGWNAVKGPLLVAFAGAGLFLYATQPDLFNATTAFASAVAAGGLPALLKLFNTFAKDDKANQ
jgi:hypothetical protein